MLLDTCALLWLTQGSDRLSEEIKLRINQEPVVYVSAISGFEVGIKYQRKKLELPALPAEWFRVITEHHDIKILPLDLAICIRSTELPAFHNDPCDRLIIASAQIHSLTVITDDPVFKKYAIAVLP